MISIRQSNASTECMVENVIKVWESATDEQLAAGRAWYPTAHRIADMMCDGDVRTGAGLLAAFSPQTPWWFNVELASDAYETGTPSRHVGDAISKATRILAGIDPESVLPMDRKTGHFFRCIVDPTDPDTVCVDRHAHDIAVGVEYGAADRGLGARGRYNLIAGIYREAAKRLGELPQTVQAVTWVVWRERLAGTSTRGALK